MVIVMIVKIPKIVLVAFAQKVKKFIFYKIIFKFISIIYNNKLHFIIAFVPEAPECEVSDPMSCSKEKHEVCLFKDGTYKCSCPNGYNRLPNGKCLVFNECEFKNNNFCSEYAECIDQVIFL